MTTTKDSLLRYFATLDVTTLERLKRYSSFIIIPDEDLLTNATMSQMVDKAHDLADSLFPEWTDRSKSDFGEFLVELFALFSEKDFWYINAFANEGIFRKIRSYSNAFSKASTIGYKATTCKGAKANFLIKFAPGEEVTYLRGELVVSVNDTEYSNDNSIIIPASSTEVTQEITLSEGKQFAEDVTFNGRNIFLRKPNIDIDSISIKIDNVQYTRVGNFGESGASSPHYIVLPEEDGSCVVLFGMDGFGVTPALGKIIQVEYRTCAGSKGNKGIGEVSISDSFEERKAISATMTTTASGGSDAETLTSIKEKAALAMTYSRAAINEEVSQNILNSYDFVAKSKVYALGNNVYYSVIPMSGALEPSDDELLYMEENFEPMMMLGCVAHNAANNYVNLMYKANHAATGLLLEVVIAPGYSADTVADSVKEVMSDITNPLVYADYGKGFSKTDAAIIIQSRVPMVQSVAFKLLVGSVEQVMPEISLLNTEIFRKLDTEYITVRVNAI